ncbi:phosphoribosylformylglycinamidine synthase subunit PurQ [Kiritimatiella glycovorans]|uniref:Phosphoribosylformylglycinamidine synthase n=1 Tax=Kiritimatiella glycovorans TaxID=1307763 RepID=A0A0G3EHZ9_9BACT|nr:phosphoribosylformylglycinamidine synthase subunit PurQ [Kiritimatiella glycovorans]AKJ65057.1 Phosphoribosylformylglycinamidine synthase [Kiritimatiella glycovorans]
MTPSVLIITGYGVNCEAESSLAWERAGARPVRVHLNDLLAAPGRIHDFGALMFIGGFSYGDHMSSGHAMAVRVGHHLRDELRRFVEDGHLILGVCNGFQVMAKMGLVPAADGELLNPSVTVMRNDCGHFQNYWVDLRFEPDSPCVFTRGLERMELPIRHGEGKVFTPDAAVLEGIEKAGCVPVRYADAEGRPAQDYPANPNGSLNAIAGLCDPTGRLFGLMPHPEAYLFPENHPRWDHRKGEGRFPEYGEGLKLFLNAVECMRQA